MDIPNELVERLNGVQYHNLALLCHKGSVAKNSLNEFAQLSIRKGSEPRAMKRLLRPIFASFVEIVGESGFLPEVAQHSIIRSEGGNTHVHDDPMRSLPARYPASLLHTDSGSISFTTVLVGQGLRFASTVSAQTDAYDDIDPSMLATTKVGEVVVYPGELRHQGPDLQTTQGTNARMHITAGFIRTPNL